MCTLYKRLSLLSLTIIESILHSFSWCIEVIILIFKVKDSGTEAESEDHYFDAVSGLGTGDQVLIPVQVPHRISQAPTDHTLKADPAEAVSNQQHPKDSQSDIKNPSVFVNANVKQTEDVLVQGEGKDETLHTEETDDNEEFCVTSENNETLSLEKSDENENLKKTEIIVTEESEQNDKKINRAQNMKGDNKTVNEQNEKEENMNIDSVSGETEGDDNEGDSGQISSGSGNYPWMAPPFNLDPQPLPGLAETSIYELAQPVPTSPSKTSDSMTASQERQLSIDKVAQGAHVSALNISSNSEVKSKGHSHTGNVDSYFVPLKEPNDATLPGLTSDIYELASDPGLQFQINQSEHSKQKKDNSRSGDKRKDKQKTKYDPPWTKEFPTDPTKGGNLQTGGGNVGVDKERDDVFNAGKFI